MEIQNTDDFLRYYRRIRSRTLRVIECVPPDQLEWTYKAGKFTMGDLIRHIAAIERFMYAESVKGNPSLYKGCGPELAAGYENVVNFFNDMHQQSLEIFSALTPEQFNGKCQTPLGSPITVWKWLRAMIEHEIHHRGQIYMYLGMLDISAPPLFGLTSEEVTSISEQSN